MYRKRWRNSIINCQAYSSSNPIGSDHRIVVATIQLSLRKSRPKSRKKLYWHAVTVDRDLSSLLDNEIDSKFSAIPACQQTYTNFVNIATKVGTELLPPKPPRPTKSIDQAPVVSARLATLRSNIRNVQDTQRNLRRSFDKCEDERINKTLLAFENTSVNIEVKNAWDLVKELSGKKSKSVIFIDGEDRLDT